MFIKKKMWLGKVRGRPLAFECGFEAGATDPLRLCVTVAATACT